MLFLLSPAKSLDYTTRPPAAFAALAARAELLGEFVVVLHPQEAPEHA